MTISHFVVQGEKTPTLYYTYYLYSQKREKNSLEQRLTLPITYLHKLLCIMWAIALKTALSVEISNRIIGKRLHCPFRCNERFNVRLTKWNYQLSSCERAIVQ